MERLAQLDRAVSSDETDVSDERLEKLDQFVILLRKYDVRRDHAFWRHYYYQKCGFLYQRQQWPAALTVAQEGISHDPNYPGVWLWKGNIEERLGELLAAFRSFKTALRRGAEPKFVLPRLVSVLLQRKRYPVAARLGSQLYDAGTIDDATLARAAEIELVLRRDDIAMTYLDAPKLRGRETDVLLSLRRRAKGLQAHQVRHIAIAGMSYVGSTLFGTILGSLPSCAHAGETQELIYRADPKSYAFPIIDFDRDPPDLIPQCKVCGPSCTVFDRTFREELKRDEVDWYFRIGRRLGARVVISSDKFLSEYLNKDPLSRYDVIVLYKPLDAWVISHRREEARKASYGVASSPAASDLVRMLNQWTSNYHGFLKDLKQQGRRIVLNWVRFAERPHEHLIAILKSFDLLGDPSVFEHIKAGHYFGGNDGIETVLREGRVEFRPPRAETPSPEDQEVLRRHVASQRVYRMLESCYRTDFRDL
jgi:tetratricopeptide (TPR) repeat protein